jgi:hypothetical protein
VELEDDFDAREEAGAEAELDDAARDEAGPCEDTGALEEGCADELEEEDGVELDAALLELETGRGEAQELT